MIGARHVPLRPEAPAGARFEVWESRDTTAIKPTLEAVYRTADDAMAACRDLFRTWGSRWVAIDTWQGDRVAQQFYSASECASPGAHARPMGAIVTAPPTTQRAPWVSAVVDHSPGALPLRHRALLRGRFLVPGDVVRRRHMTPTDWYLAALRAYATCPCATTEALVRITWQALSVTS
jgi:hypothetical protein